MELRDILAPEAVEGDCKATSKKAVLRHLAGRAEALFGLERKTLLQALMEREKLGSTGVGEGVAIPHACLDSLDQIQAVFLRMDNAIDFDALDDRPVDMFLLLLVPNDFGTEYLKLLASIARRFRSANMREMIRGAADLRQIHTVLVSLPEQG